MTSQNLSIPEYQWQRLSPLSLLFFIGRILSQFFKDGAAGIAPIAILLFNAEDKSQMAGYISLGVIVLIGISALLQFWFYQYSIQQDKILIHEGVFKKQKRTINFDRIQNINIVEPFYFRPFKLVSLRIETAGSTGDEVNLAGINEVSAKKLKQTLLTFKQAAIPDHKSAETKRGDTNNEDCLANASLPDLVKLGLTNNGFWWFFVALAPFSSLINDVLEQHIGEEFIKNLISNLGGDLFGSLVLGLGVILALFIIGMIFSIFGAIFRYFQYQLTLDNTVLKRKSGLFTTLEESTRLSKIQAVVRKTNLIGKWLKVENLILKQVSGNQNHHTKRSNLFIIPSRNLTDSEILQQKMLQINNTIGKSVGISWRYLTKYFALIGIIFIAWLFWIEIRIADEKQLIVIALSSLIVGTLLLLFVKRWQSFQYYFDADIGYFQSGLFGYKKIIFPLYKVQCVKIKQTPVQKRHDLAHLYIYLATQKIKIPYINYHMAQQYFRQISFKIETVDKEWF